MCDSAEQFDRGHPAVWQGGLMPKILTLTEGRLISSDREGLSTNMNIMGVFTSMESNSGNIGGGEPLGGMV